MTTRVQIGLVAVAAMTCVGTMGCGGGGGGNWGGGGLTAPTNLLQVAITATAITFSWSAVADATNGYEVSRMITGDWSSLGTVAAGTTQYSDTGLTAGVTYTYRVRALGAGATSAWSTAAAFTPEDGGGSATTATVRGVVISSVGGSAITGVTVTIGDLSALTDLYGHFSVANVPVGTATLWASLSGYTFGSPVSIAVVAGDNDLGNVVMTPASEGPPPPPPI